MKPLLPCAAALLTLLAASGAHAQTPDLAPISTAPIPAFAFTPALNQFADESVTSSGALPDAATLSSGLQLNRTRGKDPSWAKFASGTGNLLFLGAGTLLPLLEDGKAGQQHALRTADTLITSALFSEGLKRAFHKKRPSLRAAPSMSSIV